MDAKLLARGLSFLSIFLAIYAQTAEAFQLEAAIYYGDSSVEIGKPFMITCIIPITDPIYWIKDGEPITRHNLRHGRDEHSYTLSESAIEGEKYKIEAHISVRHALKVHEGRYQCNKLHSSYHMLQIRTPKREQQLKQQQQQQMKSPHHIGHGAGLGYGSGGSDSGIYDNVIDHSQLFTESIYENIHTSSKVNDDNDANIEMYTRTWEPVSMTTMMSPQHHTLPTQATTTQSQQKHHRTHHHHHQAKQQQHHKLPYVNVTNYDDISRIIETEKSYDVISPDFVNIPYNRYSTMEPWRNSSIYYAATPPHIPPPRTIAAIPMDVSNEDSDIAERGQFYDGDITVGGSIDKQQPEEYYATTSRGVDVDIEPFEQSSQLQKLPSQQQQQFDTMDTFLAQSLPSKATATNIYQIPLLQYNHQNPNLQNVGGQQQQQQQHYQHLITMTSGGVTSVVATSPPLFASSSNTFGLLPLGHRHAITLTSIPYLTPNNTENNINNNNNNSIITNNNNSYNVNELLLTQLNKKTEPEFLVPNYDNVEHELKVFEIRSPLVLSCNITKEGPYELAWEKNGTKVSKVKELEGRYRILDVERSFIIDRTDINDDGIYSCVADNKKRDFNVVALVAVRVPSNLNVVEGEKLSIDCTVVGTDPQLSWSFGNMTITNTTGRYVLKPNDKNVQNAILTIDNISLNDRGEFTCIGQNAANVYANFNEASDVSFVRVKGRFAALWPFLGICAEVLILCAIILIYEKRRNKTEMEDSDTDPQEQRKKRRNYD